MKTMQSKFRIIGVMVVLLLMAIAALFCVNFISNEDNTVEANAATIGSTGFKTQTMTITNNAPGPNSSSTGTHLYIITGDANIVMGTATKPVITGGATTEVKMGESITAEFITNSSNQALAFFFGRSSMGNWWDCPGRYNTNFNLAGGYAIDGYTYLWMPHYIAGSDTKTPTLANQVTYSPYGSISNATAVITKGTLTNSSDGTKNYQITATGFVPAKIYTAVPTGGTYTWDGTAKTGVASSSAYTISTDGTNLESYGTTANAYKYSNSEISANYTGTSNVPRGMYSRYLVKVTPNDGYCWTDGTTTTKEVAWYIRPRPMSDCIYNNNLNVYRTYNGSGQRLSDVDIGLKYNNLLIKQMVINNVPNSSQVYHTGDYQLTSASVWTKSGSTTTHSAYNDPPVLPGVYNFTIVISPLESKNTYDTTDTSGGNLTGSDLTLKYTMRISTPISNATVEEFPTYVYSGSQIKPGTINVSFGGETLVEGTHFTVSYGENINYGLNAGSVTLTGIASSGFTGTKTVHFAINQRSINTGVLITFPTYTYTGQQITPTKAQMTVKTADNTITLGTDDYDVTYGTNINAGTNAGSVTITGKGNFTGSYTVNFDISALSIANATMVPCKGNGDSTPITLTYTGSQLNPYFAITIPGFALGTFYLRHAESAYGLELNCLDLVNAGTSKQVELVKSTTNFTGNATDHYEIKQLSIESSAFVASMSTLYYTGEIEYSATNTSLKRSGTAMKYGTEYEVTVDSQNVGERTATFTGKFNYTGTQTVKFDIKGKLTDSFFTATIADQTYSGSALTPKFTTITYASQSPTYTMRWANNTNAATKTAANAPQVTLTGTGYYEGTTTIKFTINRLDISSSSVTIDVTAPITFTGSQFAARVFTSSNTTMKLGSTSQAITTAYTVASTGTYNKVGTNVGTATFTGTGNFTGTKTTTFDIIGNLSNTTYFSATMPSVTYNKGNALTPKPSTITFDGVTLRENTDYTLSYSNNINASSTARVTFTGKGNYAGTSSMNFTINKATPTVVYRNTVSGSNYVDLEINKTYTNIWDSVLDMSKSDFGYYLYDANGNAYVDPLFKTYFLVLCGDTLNSTCNFISELSIGDDRGLKVTTTSNVCSGGMYVLIDFNFGDLEYDAIEELTGYVGNVNNNYVEESLQISFYIRTTSDTGFYITKNSTIATTDETGQVTSEPTLTQAYYPTLAAAYAALGDSTDQTIYIKGTNTVSTSLEITQNITIKADPDGGTLTKSSSLNSPLFIQNTPTLNIEGVTINGANTSGGIVQIATSNATLNIESATISNSKNENGGVVSFADNGGTSYSGASVTILDSTIRGCSASDKGGVVYLPNGSNLTLEGNTMSGNSAVEGGVIYLEGENNLNIKDGTYSTNTAQNGGVVALSNTATSAPTISVYGSATFSSNSATSTDPNASKGGAIYLPQAANVTLADTPSFIGNTAETSGVPAGTGTGSGGAIYLTDATTIDINGGEISSNRADKGGAIYIASTEATDKGNFVVSSLAMTNNGANVFAKGICTEGQTIQLAADDGTRLMTDEIGIADTGSGSTDGKIFVTSSTLTHNIYVNFEDPASQMNAEIDLDTGETTLDANATPFVTALHSDIDGNDLKNVFRVVNSGYTFNGTGEIDGTAVKGLFMQPSVSEVARVYIGGVWKTYYSLQQAINEAAAASTYDTPCPVYLVQYQNDKNGTYSNEIEIYNTLNIPAGANISFSSVLKHTNAAGDNFVYEAITEGQTITQEPGSTTITSATHYKPTVIKRAENLVTELINVNQGASLALGISDINITGTGYSVETAGVILDGGAIYGTDGKLVVTDDNGRAGSAETNNTGTTANSPVIVNNGSLTINRGTTIQNNDNNNAQPGESFGSQNYGGGIRNQGAGNLTMNGGTIQNCYSREGGAIMNINKDIAGNDAYVEGGNPQVTINGGEIKNNVSQMKGSAIQTIYGGATTVITGGSIKNNYSVNDLGTVSVEEGGSLAIRGEVGTAPIIEAGSQTTLDEKDYEVTDINSNAVYVYNQYSVDDYAEGATPFIEGKAAAVFELSGYTSIVDDIHIDSPVTVIGQETVFAPVIDATGFKGQTGILLGTEEVTKVNITVDADRPLSNDVVVAQDVGSGSSEVLSSEALTYFTIPTMTDDTNLSNTYTYTYTDSNGNSSIRFGGYDLDITQTDSGEIIVSGTVDNLLDKITVTVDNVEYVIDLRSEDGTLSGIINATLELNKDTGVKSATPTITTKVDYSSLGGTSINGTAADTLQTTVEAATQLVLVDRSTGVATLPTGSKYLSDTGHWLDFDSASATLPNNLAIDVDGNAQFLFAGEAEEDARVITVGKRAEEPSVDSVDASLEDQTNTSLTINAVEGVEYNLVYIDRNLNILHVLADDEWASMDSETGTITFDSLLGNQVYQVIMRAKASVDEDGNATSLPSKIVTLDDCFYQTLTTEQNNQKVAYEEAYALVSGKTYDEITTADKVNVNEAFAEYEKLYIDTDPDSVAKTNLKALKADDYKDLVEKAQQIAKLEIAFILGYDNLEDLQDYLDANTTFGDIVSAVNTAFNTIDSINDTYDGTGTLNYTNLAFIVDQVKTKLNVIKTYDDIREDWLDKTGFGDVTTIYNDYISKIDAITEKNPEDPSYVYLTELETLNKEADLLLGKEEVIVELKNYLTATDSQNSQDVITAAIESIEKLGDKEDSNYSEANDTVENAKSISYAAEVNVDKIRAVEEIKAQISNLISTNYADNPAIQAIITEYFGSGGLEGSGEGGSIYAQTTKENVELFKDRALALILIEEKRAELINKIDEEYTDYEEDGTSVANDKHVAEKKAELQSILDNAITSIKTGADSSTAALVNAALAKAQTDADDKVAQYDRDIFVNAHSTILNDAEIDLNDIDAIDAALDDLETYVSLAQDDLGDLRDSLLNKKQESLIYYFGTFKEGLDEQNEIDKVVLDKINEVIESIENQDDNITGSTSVDKIVDTTLDEIRNTQPQLIGESFIDAYVNAGATSSNVTQTAQYYKDQISGKIAELAGNDPKEYIDQTTLSGIIAAARLEIDKTRASDEIHSILDSLTYIDKTGTQAQAILDKYLGDEGIIYDQSDKTAVELEMERAIAELKLEDKRAELIGYINSEYVDLNDDGSSNDRNAEEKANLVHQIIDKALGDIQSNGTEGAGIESIKAALGKAGEDALTTVDEYDAKEFKQNHSEILTTDSEIVYSSIDTIDSALNDLADYVSKSQDQTVFNEYRDNLIEKKKEALVDYIGSFKESAETSSVNDYIDTLILELKSQSTSGGTAEDGAINVGLDTSRTNMPDLIGNAYIDAYVSSGATSGNVTQTADEYKQLIEDKIAELGAKDPKEYITPQILTELLDSAKLEIDKTRALDSIEAELESLLSIDKTGEKVQAIIDKYLGENGIIYQQTDKAAIELERDRAIAELQLEDKRAEIYDFIDFATDGTTPMNDKNAQAKKDEADKIINAALEAIQAAGEAGASKEVIDAAIAEAMKNAQTVVAEYDRKQFEEAHKDILEKTDESKYEDIDAIDAALDDLATYIGTSQGEMDGFRDDLLEKKQDAIIDYLESFKDGTDIDELIDEKIKQIQDLVFTGDTDADKIVNETFDLIREQGPEDVGKLLVDRYIAAGADSDSVQEIANEFKAKLEALTSPITMDEINAIVAEAQTAIDVERYKDLNPVTRVDFDDIKGSDINTLIAAGEEYKNLPQNVQDYLDKAAQELGYKNYLDQVDDMIAKSEFETQKEETIDQVKEYVRTHDGEAVLTILNDCIANIMDNINYTPYKGDDRDGYKGGLVDNLVSADQIAKIEISHAQTQQRAENQVEQSIVGAVDSAKYNDAQKAQLETLLNEAKSEIKNISTGTSEEDLAKAKEEIDKIIQDILEKVVEVPVTKVATGGIKPDLTPVEPDGADDYVEPEVEEFWGVVTNDKSMPGGIELVIKKVDTNKMNDIENAVKNDSIKIATGSNIIKEEIPILLKDKEIKTSLDIYLLKDGMQIREFDGYYEIMILLTPQLRSMAGLQVVYVDDDGSIEVFETKIVEDKYLLFTTEHFSEFFILGEVEVNLWWLVGLLIAVVAIELILVAVFAISHRTRRTPLLVAAASESDEEENGDALATIDTEQNQPPTTDATPNVDEDTVNKSDEDTPEGKVTE